MTSLLPTTVKIAPITNVHQISHRLVKVCRQFCCRAVQKALHPTLNIPSMISFVRISTLFSEITCPSSACFCWFPSHIYHIPSLLLKPYFPFDCTTMDPIAPPPCCCHEFGELDIPASEARHPVLFFSRTNLCSSRDRGSSFLICLGSFF